MWWATVADGKAFPHSEYLTCLRWPAGVYWTRQIFLASMRNLPGLYRHIEDTLGQVQVPSLVVWGDSDPFFFLAQGQRTAAAIPGAQFIPLLGCGHFVPEERPSELVNSLRRIWR